MSKRLLLLNLVLVTAAVAFSAQLVRTFLSSAQLPPPPQIRASQPVPSPAEESARVRPSLASYDGVASKNLFTPTRSETATASVAPVAKPFLYGIVLKDGGPTAYLQDAATKKIVGYKLGDSVAGGQLERIEADRVVIRRGDETFEVLLRDPQKPKPVVAAQPPGAAPQPQAPGAPAVQAPPSAPGTAQPPTPFRRPQAPSVRNAPSE